MVERINLGVENKKNEGESNLLRTEEFWDNIEKGYIT